jgi:catechol 2,3-dioxygenase-like lactoylglutathione lyase family enzyme
MPPSGDVAGGPPIGSGRLRVRIARQTSRLDAVVTFYRDRLGLPEIGRFTGHDGYDGVMLDLPGTGTHLEFTATAHMDPPQPHVESLLVLYLGDRRRVDALVARCGAEQVPSANPYWDRTGVTIIDPDGFRIVLVADDWPS